MTIECSVDADTRLDFGEELVVSLGTEFCVECKRLIPQGEEHYRLREYRYNDDSFFSDYEQHLGIKTACEQCGDLALSLMDLGYCWYYGDLRADIAELHEEGYV